MRKRLLNPSKRVSSIMIIFFCADMHSHYFTQTLQFTRVACRFTSLQYNQIISTFRYRLQNIPRSFAIVSLNIKIFSVLSDYSLLNIINRRETNALHKVIALAFRGYNKPLLCNDSMVLINITRNTTINILYTGQ